MTTFQRLISAVPVACLSAVSEAQTDDGAWLNQGIQQAIANGQSSYSIPAGTYLIRTRLEVPPGTKNFSIVGAGSGQTKFIVDQEPWVLISVGTQLTNSSLSSRRNHPVNPVREGSRSVTLTSASTPITPGWYVLYDDQQIFHRTVTTLGIHYASEIVQVLGYNERTKTVILDVPVGRRYYVNPRLADVNNVVCHNISISGISMDGTVPSLGVGKGGLAAFGLVNGGQMSDMKVENYGSGAFVSYLSRNILFDNVSIKGASNLGPGGGYGVYVMRSRFVHIRNSYADTSRHGFIFHSGSMDCLVEDSEGNSTGGADFDTHGMDELRITFRRCFGTSGVGVGNGAWNLGGKGHLVDDCNLGTVYVGPNVASATFRRSTLGTLATWYPMMFESQPAGGPGDIRFEECNLRAHSRFISTLGSPGLTKKAQFIRCNFNATDQGIFMMYLKGNWSFLYCTFNAPKVFVLGDNCPDLFLTFMSNTCKGMSGYAMEVLSIGRANISGNRFESPNALGFFKPGFQAKGIVSNNTWLKK